MKYDETHSKPTNIFDAEVNENIGQALTLLDEFHGMIEMIRDESNEITEEHLQEFRATALKMKTLYKEIDGLEKVVKAIEENCNSVDKALQEAESETNTFSLLRNTFRQVVSSGSQAAATSSSPRRSVLPSVYETSDFLSSREASTGN